MDHRLMMPLANPATVTVRRGGGTDRNGNPIAGATHTIERCVHIPRNTSELDQSIRDTVLTGEWLWGPVEADLLPNDRVWLPRDDTAEEPPWFVDGDVQLYDDYPFKVGLADMQFFQAVLTRVEG